MKPPLNDTLDQFFQPFYVEVVLRVQWCAQSDSKPCMRPKRSVVSVSFPSALLFIVTASGLF